MATAKAKQRAHRQKALEKAKTSVKLHEPVAVEEEALKVAERIRVPSKSKSSLVQGDGRSMGMEVD
jgi:large subunit ribosomal protein L24e